MNLLSNVSLDRLFLFPEIGYLKEIIDIVEKRGVAEKYDLYINFRKTNDKSKVEIQASKKELISFITVDESGYIPVEIVSASKFVFKTYYGPEFSHYNNLYHIPQGYNPQVPFRGVLPLNERKYNVFFVGNLHIGRKKFYKFYSKGYFLPFSLLHRVRNILGNQFDHLYPDSIIRFTNKFNTGFNKDQYVDYLANAKIVLCPPGNPNKESLRVFEAMRSGCVIVTEKLPPVRWYQDSPIIQVDNWKQGHKIIKDLIKNQQKLEELHYKTINWYSDVCSPQAVAEYICDIIE